MTWPIIFIPLSAIVWVPIFLAACVIAGHVQTYSYGSSILEHIVGSFLTLGSATLVTAVGMYLYGTLFTHLWVTLPSSKVDCAPFVHTAVTQEGQAGLLAGLIMGPVAGVWALMQ